MLPLQNHSRRAYGLDRKVISTGKNVFSRACSEHLPEYPRWTRKRIEDVVWNMLMSGYLNCEDIIDPIVPFEESAEGFMKYVDQDPELSIKMGVTFDK